jgi:hypothetical protein
MSQKIWIRCEDSLYVLCRNWILSKDSAHLVRIKQLVICKAPSAHIRNFLMEDEYTLSLKSKIKTNYELILGRSSPRHSTRNER